MPGLRWSFESAVNDTIKSSRRHAWDKLGGWHRVEGVNRAGLPYLMIDHLDDATGMAWMNHNAIAGDSLTTRPEHAVA